MQRSGDPSVNGAETVSTVDSTVSVGPDTSIALGADGLPVVSYDAGNLGLKVAKCNDSACAPSVNGAESLSAVDSAVNAGRNSSITLGADGLPVVSYWDLSPNNDLKVPKCDDSACAP